MKVYGTESLRNVALVSHQGAGKTSLVEAMLFNVGVINRMGDIQQGTTVADFDEEEQRRGLSLSTALIPIEHKGNKLNLLDTPGYTDFQGEVKNAGRCERGRRGGHRGLLEFRGRVEPAQAGHHQQDGS
jgi:elongation factor G